MGWVGLGWVGLGIGDEDIRDIHSFLTRCIP